MIWLGKELYEKAMNEEVSEGRFMDKIAYRDGELFDKGKVFVTGRAPVLTRTGDSKNWVTNGDSTTVMRSVWCTPIDSKATIFLHKGQRAISLV